jgi:hypothetical protein
MSADKDNASAASVLYPTAAATAPTNAAAASTASMSDAAAVLYPSRAAQAPDAPTPAGESAATLYLDNPETFEHVQWDEPAGDAAELGHVIDDAGKRFAGFDRGDNPQNLAGAFAAAGMGQTFAREVMEHAGRASRADYRASDTASAETELRAAWGENYARNVSQVRQAVQDANARDARIVPYLLHSGLGNDVAFIRKTYAALQRRR